MDFREEDLSKEAVLPDETGMATGTNDDGTNVATGKKEETPAEATAAKETKEQTPSSVEDKKSDEDKLPFHEHPRWIQREQEWNKKIDETRADYEARMEELKSNLESRLPKQVGPIPDFFKKVYGDDPELYREWQAEQDAQAARIKEEAIAEYEQRLERQRQAAEAKNQHWANWVTSSVQKLKDEGKTFDENRLKQIALRDMPSDLEGNIDFQKAYNIMVLEDKAEAAANKNKITARKEIAAQTETTPRGEAPVKDYLTHDEIRKGAANI